MVVNERSEALPLLIDLRRNCLSSSEQSSFGVSQLKLLNAFLAASDTAMECEESATVGSALDREFFEALNISLAAKLTKGASRSVLPGGKRMV